MISLSEREREREISVIRVAVAHVPTNNRFAYARQGFTPFALDNVRVSPPAREVSPLSQDAEGVNPCLPRFSPASKRTSPKWSMLGIEPGTSGVIGGGLIHYTSEVFSK